MRESKWQPRQQASWAFGHGSAIMKYTCEIGVVLEGKEAKEAPPKQLPDLNAWQPTSQAGSFLEGLYRLESSGNSRKAVDQLIDCVDDLLTNGKFDECDELLRQVDVAKISPTLIITFLGITRAAKEKLRSRSLLCNRIKDKLVAEVGKERAERLLNKYT